MQLNLVAEKPKEPKKRPASDSADGAAAAEEHQSRSKSDKKPRLDDNSSKKHSGGSGSSSGAAAGDQKQAGDYISSLFNHNPEIPQLEFSNVQPVQETIFTTRSFQDVGIHPHLVKNLVDFGVKSMTTVQSKAIPVIMADKDVLVKSQTGSGKTLAFAVPILQKLQEIRPKTQRSDGTYALIIVPTRELAIQCFEWFQKICRSFAWIVPGVLLGGEKKKSEKARVRKGINILISTPGRLIDHITHTKCLSLDKIKWLVLDEADRMLELGYERDVQTILTALNEQQKEGGSRQTMLLSATLTTGIEQLSEVSMKHPTFIDAATSNDEAAAGAAAGDAAAPQAAGVATDLDNGHELTTPENLKQNFIIVPAKLRLVMLAAFILWKTRFSGKARKILVFLSTQDMVDFHCELFDRCLNSDATGPAAGGADVNAEDEGEEEITEDAKEVMKLNKISLEKNKKKTKVGSKIELLKLHGSMKQKDRLEVFNAFRDSNAGGVLFSTDVAARGLDLPAVDWIVQYNPPTSNADYVHRVGRTARIGSKGSSLLFVLPSEANFVLELESHKLVLAELTAEHVLDKLFRNNPEPSQKHGGRLPNTLEESATNLQMKMENAVAADEKLHESASQAYVSFVRSYASYPKEIRHIFSFKALHLGHIAKSYALRDPPNKITGIGKGGGNWVRKEELRKRDNYKQKQQELKREQSIIKAQKKRINQKSLIVSEFDSGFKGIEAQAVKAKEKEARKQFKKKVK